MIKPDCYNHFGAHLISATVPTMCEDYWRPYLCQLYPQTCLTTGICLGPIGLRMLEYGLLLYCDGGKIYDKKETSWRRAWSVASTTEMFFFDTAKKKCDISLESGRPPLYS